MSPEMSRFVPVCLLLSFLGPGTNRDKRGQTGTKTGHFGKIWETPPVRFYPHLPLVKYQKKSGKKKEHKLKLWVRTSSGGVGIFRLNGWGPKILACPEKFEKKKLVFNSRPLEIGKRAFRGRKPLPPTTPKRAF